MNTQNIDFKQLDLSVGSLSLWIEEAKLTWNDNKSTVIFNVAKSNGSLFIIKDDDNKLKCFHVILDNGKTSVESDVSKLSINEAHHIVITWDIEKSKKLLLYIDAQLKDEKPIE